MSIGLLKITFAVKQADADEAEAEVAGGFRVVAGQDAEAAGGNGQRFVKAELGGKIGDGILVQLRRVFVSPGVLLVQVRLEIVQTPRGRGIAKSASCRRTRSSYSETSRRTATAL